ncbi:MAG: 30S ribosomal protein S17 [Kiritimatiellae bacterium]|nr:30S ribosomal protein S17 [Kiritimatiellia bacterium]
MPDNGRQRGLRKEREGVVVSDAMDKTIVVRVERKEQHPLYGKERRLAKKYHAHDEKNEARLGDRVRIAETRPLSRLKRWRLKEILATAETNKEDAGAGNEQ